MVLEEVDGYKMMKFFFAFEHHVWGVNDDVLIKQPLRLNINLQYVPVCSIIM